MEDITPKSRTEGLRGYVVRTRPWAEIVERYRGVASFAPMVRLVEAVAASSVSTQLFGAPSMFELLISDCADFRRGDSTLFITYRPSDGMFEFRHQSYSGRDDHKICSESEALETFRLFVKLKFGVLFEKPVA